ncbi:TetR family transcriptional regulator [Streptomyces sp. NPDC085524]|uniref:TetR family transcriptional regulator n=1 Tax=Streptomyces sp. NPDC085524 TaxID=3365728 RepID=UPI0037CCFFA7
MTVGTCPQVRQEDRVFRVTEPESGTSETDYETDYETVCETDCRTPGHEAGRTRQRILEASMELFGVRGFHETSLREIAERVGVTKAAVLYHFPGKADILGALVEPMLVDLAAAMANAAAAGPGRARWAAVEGMLDVWLEHRYLIRLNLQDMALATPGPAFARFRDAMLRANALVAGADPDLAERVRAAQAVAMLSDPVVLFADAPVGALRAAVLDGVHRLLDGTAEPAAGPPPPARSRRGRPATMSTAMVETARRMHAAGSSAPQIAAALGVSRATVYRHLPPAAPPPA